MTFETIVTTTPDGRVTVETVGYTGESCRLADAWVRDAIGESLPRKEGASSAPHVTSSTSP